MAAIFRVRDENGTIRIDENMLLSRYIATVTIAWNDVSAHTFTHPAFSLGTPFYHVVNHNRHELNILDPNAVGTPSYVECSFTSTSVTYQQVWTVLNNSQFNYVGRNDLIVHFGVFG